ncbi:DUF1893 domain-containing protein [Clostridium sp.]|uniref:DUF1893 domain-containing protein n=1 Tax=Clostridium sp. TaxID=1506 RepID=UPI003463E2EF
MKTRIKTLLEEYKYSCILMNKEKTVMTSFDKGVNPIYKYIKENGVSPIPLIMGDKIVGKAVALLAIYAGVEYIYTSIISQGAIDILNSHNIKFDYKEIVPFISNRKKDGQCPMEASLSSTINPKEGFDIIDTFIKNRELKECTK